MASIFQHTGPIPTNMLFCDSVIAVATREGVTHTVGPYLLSYLSDAFHGYITIFRAYDEARHLLV